MNIRSAAAVSPASVIVVTMALIFGGAGLAGAAGEAVEAAGIAGVCASAPETRRGSPTSAAATRTRNIMNKIRPRVRRAFRPSGAPPTCSG